MSQQSATSQIPITPPQARPQRSRPLRAAGWTLVGVGVLGVVAGATLWSFHGYQNCPQAPDCDLEFSSLVPGVLLVVAGGLSLGTGGLLVGLDARAAAPGPAQALSLRLRF